MYALDENYRFRRLFEVDDSYEQNKIRLTKDMNQLKDRLKVHIDKVEELNQKLLEMRKQKETVEPKLSEMKKQKEIVESKCLELETTTFSLVQDVNQAQTLNKTLKKSLEDA